MNLLRRLSLKIKAVSQLGFRQSFNFLLYQLGLRSGYFTLVTPPLELNALLKDDQLDPNWFMVLPNKTLLANALGKRTQDCKTEADLILQRQILFFGGEKKSLNLAPEKEPLHWTRYERGSARANFKDVKYAWEPARINWAVTLAKAYYFYGDENYAEAFWPVSYTHLTLPTIYSV
jgi:hypothetical protein